MWVDCKLALNLALSLIALAEISLEEDLLPVKLDTFTRFRSIFLRLNELLDLLLRRLESVLLLLFHLVRNLDGVVAYPIYTLARLFLLRRT